ncbi:DUF2384 domain-containing protein [Fulvivirga sp. M361]|uniref:antitoxin Xre-like helix-turn-helix domain-containing protein n=1 Tax=Fulvivirga sp. M361 TaxID=2594266 RepID=UPI00117B45EB|nr:antitoxin Xre-like helix-turn-helix domain-containing protein [Fulvivirga sp. M361]TRX47207.1 DUF2384 domain-containing protein [Fulvivirga sp. M361]
MGAELLILQKQTIYELLSGFLYKGEQVPASSLKTFIDSIETSQNTASKLLGVSTRTLQRELNQDHLSKDISDRFLQVIDLYKEGVEAFFDLETFKNWLETGKSIFHGKKPFELMHSITGIQQVKEEIIRTKMGILS